MLALTDDARRAVEGLLDQAEPGAGLRIAPAADNGSAAQLQLSVVPAPAATDHVIDEPSVQVFVDESASEFLDDKVLDADVTGEGIQFALAPQAP